MKLIIDKNEAFILNDKEEKIASTTNDNLPFIDFNGFEGICGWFDVEKLAQTLALEAGWDWYNTETSSRRIFELWAKQKAQELLSDRRFTIEDMLEFYYWLKKSYGPTKPLEEAQIVHRTTPNKIVEMFTQSLSQPKSWNIELEMETTVIKQNQCINKCVSYPSECLCEMTKDTKPKITNGKIKITKIL